MKRALSIIFAALMILLCLLAAEVIRTPRHNGLEAGINPATAQSMNPMQIIHLRE
jgi:hypothetical protein